MSRPWMPLYIADYLADTMHLSTAEHGAYLLLIMHYWRTGGIPDDDGQIQRVVRMSAGEWSTARPTIEALFQPGWRHHRIDEELSKASEHHERLSAAGRRGGSRKRSSQASTEDEARLKPDDNTEPSQAKAESQSQSQKEDRMVDAPARESVPKSKFTDGSKALADAFWRAIGCKSPLEIPPQLAGVDWRAVEWERAGWTVDLIGTEAKRLALDQPLKPLTYFEKVFATAFAKRQAPLPVVEVRDSEKLTVTTHGHGKTQPRSGSLIAAIDREIENLQRAEADDPQLREVPILRLPG